MKILVINWQDIKNPLGGGAEVHMHEIFKRIAARGHEVTILCCKFDGAIEKEIIDGIRIIRKGKRHFFNFIVPGMYKKLREEAFDIIIDDINKIPFYSPLFVKEPLMGISHHFFGKSIYRETNFIFGTYVYFSEWLVDFVYKKTPFCVVSDSTLDEFITRGFDKSRFSIVPNAITQEEFPMAVSEKSEKPVIAYFGRLKKYKSVDHLLLAFSKIMNNIDGIELYLMGTGDFRPYLEKLANELGINERTKFFGYVSEEDKIRLLGLSHCVVNTSMKEGWGITNIEANACGTPVISADSPGLRDSVKPGVSGMLYEYGNIEALAKTLLDFFNDTSLKEELYKGSVAWASEFSWDKSADLMIEACEKVIDDFIK